MNPKEDNRLRELVKELVNTINSVFSESQEIKDVLRNIENEGYHVDLILASITKILKKRDVSGQDELKFEFNSFDKAFLKSINIGLEDRDY